MPRLEPIDPLVIERRNAAVVAWRKPCKPRLAGMHDERRDTRRHERAGERFQRFFRILLVNAETAFDRNRHAYLGPHGSDAICDQLRLCHQTGTEAAFLHAVGRTPDIEVHLVVTQVGGDLCTLCKASRVAPAELERERMLGRMIGQEPCAIAVEHRTRGDHLGVDAGAAREQAMEEAAMPVRPFHHGGDAKAVGLVVQ